MQRIALSVLLLLAAVLAPALQIPAGAQEQYQFESDLVAKHRLFYPLGAGFRGVRRGLNGNYYVLISPSPSVQIYNAAGTRIGQVPNESAMTAKGAALVYGESFDVDGDGRVAVCDRGSNAVKIYAPSGSLSNTIPVSNPVSVVFVSGGELAVTSLNANHLVTAYDLQGNVAREYGEIEPIADEPDINRQANYGHLGADEMGNTYFAFDYMPEPTVRKFDHVGYLTMELSLMTLEFQPAAQAARKAIARAENNVPALHRIINAVGIDPKTQEIWMAIGTLLMHFDKDGQRIASFRTYLPQGARVEPSMILVEPDRLVIGTDPQGIYEFPKPARLPQ
jgi:hypothetical protein